MADDYQVEKELEEIIKAVKADMKAGRIQRVSGNPEDDAVEEVRTRVRNRHTNPPDKVGLEGPPVSSVEPTRIVDVWDWAAKQYIKERFRDS